MTAELVIPVIMLVWQRLDLLEQTLRLLAAQRDVRVHFYIYNNNTQIRASIDAIVARFSPLLTVQVAHGDNGAGCFSRFLWLEQLRPRYPYFVMIDDDQVFASDFLSTLWREKLAKGVVACHAFDIRARQDYWRKKRVMPGQSANYVGPGGMIIDTRLLGSPKLLSCPEQFRMMDDIWLSYVLNHHLGAPMRRSSARVTMLDHDRDTFRGLVEEKSLGLETLRRAGWRV